MWTFEIKRTKEKLALVIFLATNSNIALAVVVTYSAYYNSILLKKLSRRQSQFIFCPLIAQILGPKTIVLLEESC